MQGTPQGVTGADARDDVTSSRAVAEYFWTAGRMLPPILGPLRNGTRVRVFYGGIDAVQVQFGNGFSHETTVITTRAGFDSMIGELLAAKVRADIACEQAGPVGEVHEDDVPW